MPITPKYFFCLDKSLHLFETHCDFLNWVLTFLTLQKLRNLAVICHTTELVRGMGLFLVWWHRLICIVLSLCKHACKDVCDVKQGIDLYPLLARSRDRWWPDFVTFKACKRSIVGLKRGKTAQCVPNRCKDLFNRPHFLWVYRSSNPRGMFGRAREKFVNHEPQMLRCCLTFIGSQFIVV